MPSEERGIALVTVLLFMALLVLLGAAFLNLSSTETQIAMNERNAVQAFYAAEAGLEKGLVDLRNLLSQNGEPTDAQLAALTPPDLSDQNYAFDTFVVTRINAEPYQTVIPTGLYEGLSARMTDFQITAEVSGPRGGRARLMRVVHYEEVPLFQFGVFYGTGVNLEISPGPSMTFNGRVHSNSNIYLAAGRTLRFDSFVTTSGDIYRYEKMDPSARRNNPEIKDASGTYRTLNFDHEHDQDFDDPWSEAEWRSTALNTFDGLVLDSAMDVQAILPAIPHVLYDRDNPDVSAHLMIERGDLLDTPEMQEAKLYYKAGLRIETNDAGVLEATDNSGNTVNLSALGCDANTFTNMTFHDKRELRDMTITQVNIGKLMACGAAPANGILYISHEGANPGVRVVNGAELPNGGLTVVSENPMYVQGDFNRVNKQPAAIMADAITVLSNNWGPNNSDAKGSWETYKRPATDTTVNAAFALGPDHESNSTYNNGGLENSIRFLEDWSGETFTYNGSIVALWHSLQATGDHRCCGSYGDKYYRPPVRNWGYDPLFDTDLPPEGPRGVIVTRGAWSEE